MREYITTDRVANSIMQLEDNYDSFIIVEGNNDNLLLNKFVVKSTCKIEIANGYANVIEIVSILNGNKFKKHIGIIDSDFRKLENDIPNVSAVLLTDLHDIELMTIISDSFELLIIEYCKEEKLLTFLTQHNGKDLRDIFFSIIKPFACLRLVNYRNNYGLVFKPIKDDGNQLNISDFIDPSTLSFLGVDKMVQTVLNYSNGKSKVKATKEEIVGEVENISKQSFENLQLCNGHDFVKLFSLSLRKVISNLNSKAISIDQLERELLLSYDSNCFKKSELYKSIKKWEAKRSKQVLKF